MHEGHHTLITGASSGIGRRIALTLGAQSNLILSGRNEERLTEVARQCGEEGARVRLFPFDLEQCERLDHALGAFLTDEKIKVDRFIHCAGMTGVLPMARMTYKTGLKVMNVNYFSATQISSVLLKKKINGDALRSILFITSTRAEIGGKYLSHYAASKAALNNLTKSLAHELAPVRVNAIAPGTVRTEMLRDIFDDPDVYAEFLSRLLLREGETEDIANMAEFLLSKKAEWITGQVFTVDGGESIPRI